MRLALIRRQFSATGGAELYLQRLLAALVATGHEVHLYAEAWQEQSQGVTFHAVKAGGSRAKRAWRFAEAVKKLLKTEPFDSVLSLERTLQQDVYRAGDGLHRVWLERRRQFAPWWKKPFIGRSSFHRKMMALEAQTFDPVHTRRIIVNSQMVSREIERHFPAFPQDRIHLVRNGVEVSRFQKADRKASRARFGLHAEDFVLAFVGSGWERKGLPWLLHYMDLHRDDTNLKLLVTTRDHISIPLPPNVVLTGPLTDVETVYAAADLLTFLPIYEPCSNVVSEALASGLPVITTVMNGAAEWIEPGMNGHVIDDPRDSDTLERLIQHWRLNRPHSVCTREPLDLDTNVQSTIAVLEMATRDKQSC